MTIRATLINASTDTLLAVQAPTGKYEGPGKNLLIFFQNAAVYFGLGICVIAVIGGAVTLVIARFAQHGTAQKAGAVAVFLGLIGAALIGGAALIVRTGYEQGL